ncbi:TPA: M48 family metalloprotease [Klebsiella pneumoniae]
MMRIALFLLTNLAVMVVFGLVLSLTGIQSSSMTGLLIMALLFGFGGSIVSLMMSKWMALKSVGGEVIEQPRNETERWLMNTVAQQAQQVGIAMPQVAIYHAPDINAFAVATVLELVFGILASIITMWFSRYREFHADAGSARLVGREKMIAALQRLKTSYEPQEASSMMAFCINGKAKSMSELFMTHPPLDKRIEALRSGEYLK